LVESFDQSLKYLLQHQPADFIRFGLADPAVVVIAPICDDPADPAAYFGKRVGDLRAAGCTGWNAGGIADARGVH
jgi:hypothetical protein